LESPYSTRNVRITSDQIARKTAVPQNVGAEVGEAERDYIRLHLEKESHFVRDTMNNFQKRLSKDEFIRIHRSTNVNKISEILPLLGATTPWS
jgi:hypothetical protein